MSTPRLCMLSLTRCCGWRAVETHCQGGAHAHPSHLYSAGNDPPYDAPDSKNFQNFMIPPDRPSFGVSRTRGRKLAASGRFTLAAATFARLLRAYCMGERGAAGSRAFARAGEGAGFGAVVAPASGSLVRAFAGAADGCLAHRSHRRALECAVPCRSFINSDRAVQQGWVAFGRARSTDRHVRFVWQLRRTPERDCSELDGRARACLEKLAAPAYVGSCYRRKRASSAPPIHAEVLMRRPPRPFTVEIKSSRRPASSRTPVPALVDRSRTEPLFQDLLLRGNQEAGQDRRPAQEAARSEAHQGFRRLASSVPGPGQTADRPPLAQDNLEGKAAAPEPLRSAAARLEPRQGRVLPDLLSLSPAGAPLSPRGSKHSAPHKPKVQQRVNLTLLRFRRASIRQKRLSRLAVITANGPRWRCLSRLIRWRERLSSTGACRPTRAQRLQRALSSAHPSRAVIRARSVRVGCIAPHIGKPTAGAKLCPSRPVRRVERWNVVAPGVV